MNTNAVFTKQEFVDNLKKMFAEAGIDFGYKDTIRSVALEMGISDEALNNYLSTEKKGKNKGEPNNTTPDISNINKMAAYFTTKGVENSARRLIMLIDGVDEKENKTTFNSSPKVKSNKKSVIQTNTPVTIQHDEFEKLIYKLFRQMIKEEIEDGIADILHAENSLLPLRQIFDRAYKNFERSVDYFCIHMEQEHQQKITEFMRHDMDNEIKEQFIKYISKELRKEFKK